MNFTSSKNIDFSSRKLRLNDWFLVIQKTIHFGRGYTRLNFRWYKKNEQKNEYPHKKIGLQLRINTHSVDNFVAHNVKIKYFRVAFEWRVLFDQKSLKFDIKFTRDFMRKTFLKPTQIDSELKTKPKIFNTLVQLTMYFYE
jgi:hypothetical protein